MSNELVSSMFLSKKNSRGCMIALKVPLDVANQIILPEGEEADDLHITLYYLRDATDKQVAGMLYIANLLAEQFTTKKINISGSGVFELDNDERVLYLTANDSYLEPMRDFVYRSLYNMNVDYPTNTGYLPHISLKYYENKDDVIEHINTPVKEFNVSQIMFTYGGNELLLPLANSDSLVDLSAITPSLDVLELSYNDISKSAKEAVACFSKYELKSNGMYYSLSKPMQKKSVNDVMAFPSHELVDMNGNVFKFDKATVNEYLENTRQRINSIKNKDGKVVGLPVDMKGHADGDSAAWIVDVQLSQNIVDGESIPVIIGTFEWTSVGESKVRENLVKFFSPTIDTYLKVILGGSLTNWPGTVDKKGQPLMNPLMLQSQKVRIQMNDVVETKDDAIAELSENPEIVKSAKVLVTKLLASKDSESNLNLISMLGLDGIINDYKEANSQVLMAQLEAVRTEARMQAQEEIQTITRNGVIMELSKGLTAGHPVNGKTIKHILPIPQEQLKAFLSSLNTKQLKEAQSIFMNLAMNGTSLAVEEGFSGQEEPKPQLLELPLGAKMVLQSGKLNLDQVFKMSKHFNLEARSAYNLEGFK